MLVSLLGPHTHTEWDRVGPTRCRGPLGRENRIAEVSIHRTGREKPRKGNCRLNSRKQNLK